MPQTHEDSNGPPVKNKREVMAKLRTLLPELRTSHHVKAMGLFGSYARDEQSLQSDVDILVEFAGPAGFFELIALEDFLTEKLGMKVDMVTLDALKPVIKANVLRDVAYA